MSVRIESYEIFEDVDDGSNFDNQQLYSAYSVGNKTRRGKKSTHYLVPDSTPR